MLFRSGGGNSGTTMSLLPYVPTRSGYTFNGWNSKKNGKGKNYKYLYWREWDKNRDSEFERDGLITEVRKALKTRLFRGSRICRYLPSNSARFAFGNLTRNAFAFTGTRVRIPPSPPHRRRKLHIACGGFLFYKLPRFCLNCLLNCRELNLYLLQ